MIDVPVEMRECSSAYFSAESVKVFVSCWQPLQDIANLIEN